MPDYGWDVWVYYAVDCYYTDEIADKLRSIGCSGDILRRAVASMKKCQLNTGLCFSGENKSVVVIAMTSSSAQFADSYDHEKGHLVRHISRALGFDPYGEREQYLAGEISRRMFPIARHFLCEHCRRYMRL